MGQAVGILKKRGRGLEPPYELCINCVHFIGPKKPVPGLLSNFVHFIHPYMNRLLNEHISRSTV